MKIRTEKVIDVGDWDKLVQETYKRIYVFQQQDGCRGRGVFHLTVPIADPEDYPKDSIQEVVNGPERGVSFKSWLDRNPDQKLSDPQYQAGYCLSLWWRRNFYPHIEIVANDLHNRGLLEAGEYTINIDW